ncbi:PREDICTED: uncharacterized protein LOC109351535 isoform X2 [Lupinus angustifolius]|uniref:uncharacterized protein LOC109351535 isoform X2 n=1 Tax=Lupinus angustifolius TaxID=3871 RepID=UPI00092F67E2|nr:PREDICTED: uncharacterized protein LOC109351535 isoform X2 [Lupinus angustifolius]
MSWNHTTLNLFHILHIQQNTYFKNMITLLKEMKMSKMRKTTLVMLITMMTMMFVTTDAGDTNDVYSPCLDSKVQRGDGFTFGIAFSDKQFFSQGNGPQLSPCDKRLDLANKGAQLAVFRPKIDEISLLTINNSTFNPAQSGEYMVAFAGQKYAARSPPIMFADNTHTITSFTLVLEFYEGTLQNLFWKSFGCGACSGGKVCLNNQDCAVPNTKCQSNGGTACNIGIQLTFSGTDKNLDALNSWYEVKNLRQYSLYGLFSDLRDSIMGQFF